MDRLEPPSGINPDVPEDLEKVILLCLEKSPEDGFQDAESLGKALAACQGAGQWTEELAKSWWLMLKR